MATAAKEKISKQLPPPASALVIGRNHARTSAKP
jgi:hypothetical protein